MYFAYAIYLLENAHVFNKEPKILHFAEKGFKLLLLKSLEISKYLNNKGIIMFNDQHEWIKFHLLQGIATPSRKQTISI